MQIDRLAAFLHDCQRYRAGFPEYRFRHAVFFRLLFPGFFRHAVSFGQRLEHLLYSAILLKSFQNMLRCKGDTVEIDAQGVRYRVDNS